jgi:hypothetical protein
MKKILSATLLTFATSIAFANTTTIAINKKSTLENPVNYWSIEKPGDIISFTNIANAPMNVQVSVNTPLYPTTSVDAVTVICNNKNYLVNPGSALVCPVAGNSVMQIEDQNFTAGSNGTYAVLQ